MNFRHFSDENHGEIFKGAVHYFKISVACAVAAIPEGLPTIITTCLALGTRKMTRKNAIVRRLQSVEALGGTTIICSGNTGIITSNETSVTQFSYANQSQFDILTHNVEGTTFEPQGDITMFGYDYLKKATVQKLVEIAALCNTSTVALIKEQYKIAGSPTEAALRILVEKIGKFDSSFSSSEIPTPYNSNIKSQFQVKKIFEFTKERKQMSVLVCKNDRAIHEMLIKGAPEVILQNCDRILIADGKEEVITQRFREEIDYLMKRMFQNSLKVLALAYKNDNQIQVTFNESNQQQHLLEESNQYEKGLVFVGLVAIRNPIRTEVYESIQVCKKAGIRVIITTGENKELAEAIAKQIGILEPTLYNTSFTGQELDKMSDENIMKILDIANVFSRLEPRHKLKIISTFSTKNQNVAITGNGVSDCSFLKHSPIGIAMGNYGTKAAQESSNLILADDNFSTIISAIEESRSLYINTQAFLRYLIPSNIGEVISILLQTFLGIPEILTCVQLLWIKLVTDGLPATALGFNPSESDIMTKKPRNKSEPIISN